MHISKRFSTKILMLMFCAFMLITLTFSSAYVLYTLRSTRESVYKDVEVSANRAKNELNDLFEKTEKLYLGLISDPQLYDCLVALDAKQAASSQQQIHDIMYVYIRYINEIASVQILSDDYTFYTDNSTYASSQNVRYADFYQKAKTETQPFWVSTYDFTRAYGHFWSEKLEIPLPDRYFVSYAGTMNAFRYKNGVLKFWPTEREKPVLVINIRLSVLEAILADAISQEGSACFIKDQEGSVLASEGMIPEDTNINTAENGGWIEIQDGYLYSEKLHNGWQLIYKIPRSVFTKEIVATLKKILLPVILTALLLLTLLSVLITRQLSQPINRLLQAIRFAGRGNFNIDLPKYGNEFDVLNTAFSDMTRQIDTLMRENYETGIKEKESEMRALKYQTKPHFLYNTLSMIRLTALRNGDTESANMLMALSGVMRYVLRGDRDMATLREELHNVMEYFELIRVGYEGRITLKIDVPASVLNAALPKMTLQPLVENCVQHGLAGIPEGGSVTISGRMDGENVVLSVTDDGRGWPEGFVIDGKHASMDSIGMSNVEKRLRLVFDDRSRMVAMQSPEGHGATIEITFPFTFVNSEMM